MSVTHHANTRAALVTTTNTRLDLGTGSGTLEIRSASDAEVSTLTLSDPVGSVSAAVLTFSAITNSPASTGGTAAKFAIKNANGEEVVYGSVSASGGGGDIILSSVTVGALATVSILSLTYTAPV